MWTLAHCGLFPHVFCCEIIFIEAFLVLLPPVASERSPILSQFSSVQFSCSVVSDSLRPLGLQHAMPPCPSPAPGVYPNSCPLSRWCHPTISSSVVHFSSWLQPFPTSGSFPWGSSLHQVAKVLEFSFGISPSNEYLGLISFRTDWFDLRAVQVSRVFSKTTVQKHQFFSAQPSL